MKLVVVAVGKMRDRHMAALCDDYVQRARRHLPVEIVEVEDDDALARRLPARAELIALEPGGDAWTTEQLAKHVEHQMVHGTQAIAFLIGGALGLPKEVVKKASRRLSLSNLTLPHRLARVVLCEQLYRAMSIIRGEPYHH
ncbi:MAG TPA: 23S rRNA (pseudouridine(1915)-N(3))-methyltransferase RlmH [Polyangia bacterium]|jgi:23S rRNA (pseudouridine1915-N3)-methyltransferase|nr:23S rRNA (pseudouridine(1915)-N(3))-methyltransferase RlmH [Polyangia bacterium]